MDAIDVKELERRWRPLTEDETERATALLADACLQIDAEATVDVPPEVRVMIACSMVKRAMSAGSYAPFGASSTSWTASPYGGSTQWANPSGDMYMTKSEKKLLGIGLGRVGFSAFIGAE